MNRHARHWHARQSGFTLIELLIVISLMGIVAGLVITNSNPNLHEQLNTAADVLVGDVAYARSLAVSNSSNYRITFDLVQNQYVLEHVGSNPALDTLPKSPFARSSDPSDQLIVRLAKLPHVGASVRLHGVRTVAASPQTITDVEFGPLGETTRSEETRVWFAAGSGTASRYISVRINAVTGLTWIENYQANDPFVPSAPSGS